MAVFVMVIDDSAVIRKILETCLHRAGYKVKSFEDGVRALLWLNSSARLFPSQARTGVAILICICGQAQLIRSKRQKRQD